MSFSNAQKEVDEWISQFKEGYWKPLSMLARITEEVGELARELNAVYGEKPKKPGEKEAPIDEEIADILFVLVALANSLDIELDAAFSKVMNKYRTRDAQRWTPK
jgi:Predicted pyrophosphatase